MPKARSKNTETYEQDMASSTALQFRRVHVTEERGAMSLGVLDVVVFLPPGSYLVLPMRGLAEAQLLAHKLWS